MTKRLKKLAKLGYDRRAEFEEDRVGVFIKKWDDLEHEMGPKVADQTKQAWFTLTEAVLTEVLQDMYDNHGQGDSTYSKVHQRLVLLQAESLGITLKHKRESTDETS